MGMTAMADGTVPGLARMELLYRGKVRDVFDAGAGRLLMAVSPRVSAFDVVFPEPVPLKAEVLNLLAAWWFARTGHIVPNHVIETRAARIFGEASRDAREWRGRVSLVRRTTPIRFECVVRGHLDGSAWREYRHSGTVCGHRLPAGLQRYSRLPEPVFTPATKAETGHDENVTRDAMASAVGVELARRLEHASLSLYRFAYDLLAPRGIALLDTKFEFGTDANGALTLIDEIFTPDSSRYRATDPETGEVDALDKQFLRDWLVAQGFDGSGAPPPLPPEIVAGLSGRYREAFLRITGESIEEAVMREG